MNFILTFWAQLLQQSGFAALSWQQAVMIAHQLCADVSWPRQEQYEPLLLLPISFGIFLTNLPLTGMMEYGAGTAWLTSPRAFWASSTTPVFPPSCSPASCSWPWAP